MFVVFDLDGTLALNAHRLHHIQGDKRDYEAYEAECGLDQPCLPMLSTIQAHLFANHRVEIWTGRSDRVCDVTRGWLVGNGADPNLLTRMRRWGDTSPNVDLKRGWLEEVRAVGRMPDLAYDDDDTITAMWREAGVPCFQVVAR